MTHHCRGQRANALPHWSKRAACGWSTDSCIVVASILLVHKRSLFFSELLLLIPLLTEVIGGLREYFDIAAVSIDEYERYQLRGWAGTRPVRTLVPISSRLRAQALASGRCAMCGRTPVDHKVVLEVSLRIPAEWGGANDPENLWPLCQDCHQGRRKYLQTFAPYESQISRAASLDEPQRRIGELLKAFKG